jgi:hypothetical protein
MTHPSISAYLASARRQDLVREAEYAALVGEALHQTPSRWSRAVRVVAKLLIDAGHQMQSRLAQTDMTTTHVTPMTTMTPMTPMTTTHVTPMTTMTTMTTTHVTPSMAHVHSQRMGHGLSERDATEARSWSRRVGQRAVASACTTATVCCCAPCS